MKTWEKVKYALNKQSNELVSSANGNIESIAKSIEGLERVITQLDTEIEEAQKMISDIEDVVTEMVKAREDNIMLVGRLRTIID